MNLTAFLLYSRFVERKEQPLIELRPGSISRPRWRAMVAYLNTHHTGDFIVK